MLIPEQIALLLEAGGDGSCDLVFREAIVGGNSICPDLHLELGLIFPISVYRQKVQVRI